MRDTLGQILVKFKGQYSFFLVKTKKKSRAPMTFALIIQITLTSQLNFCSPKNEDRKNFFFELVFDVSRILDVS